MEWTTEQLAMLLARSQKEPRKNLKRFLKDNGGTGSAEELDELLERAAADGHVVRRANDIAFERSRSRQAIEQSVEIQLNSMRLEIVRALESGSIEIAELASRCGWTATFTSDLVSGRKIPSSEQLAKIAIACECDWKLVRKK